MLSEVNRVAEAKLTRLVDAVLACAARDRTDKADIGFGLEKSLDIGRALQHVLQVTAVVGFREKDGLARGLVVHEMHESLAKHAFPGAMSSHTFSGCAAPEENIHFILEAGIRKFFIESILALFQVIPGRWVSDIDKTRSATLTEDWDHVMSTHEASGTEMHAVQIGDVWLVTGLR
jgi:hypothetical protein